MLFEYLLQEHKKAHVLVITAAQEVILNLVLESNRHLIVLTILCFGY